MAALAHHRALEPAVAPLRARQLEPPQRRGDGVERDAGRWCRPHAALLSARGLVVARRARRAAAVGGDVFKHHLVLEPLRGVAHRRHGARVAAHPPALPRPARLQVPLARRAEVARGGGGQRAETRLHLGRQRRNDGGQ